VGRIHDGNTEEKNNGYVALKYPWISWEINRTVVRVEALFRPSPPLSTVLEVLNNL
jgi:hypothetical protein